MNLKRLLLMGVLLTQTLPAAAQELTVSAEERALLGIETQTLATHEQRRTGELTLRTAFAPDGQWLIKTPFSGTLHHVFVQEGDRVEAGDALITINSSEVVEMQGDFLQAQANLTLQESTWLREKKLNEAGSLSSKRWQETRFAYDMSRAAVAGLTAQLELAGFSDTEREKLSRNMVISPEFTLHAPAAAVVIEQPAILGDHLDGSELLIRLGQPGNLVLEGVLSRSAAEHLQQGTRLQHQDSQTEAILVFVSSVIDPASQTVHVRAIPIGPSGLNPGQLTRWSLLSRDALMIIPSNAVVRLAGEDIVYVTTATGFTPRKVGVRSTGSGWLVIEGLEAGEQIAVSGTAALKGMSGGMGGGDG